MKYYPIICAAAATAISLSSCSNNQNANNMDNPFLVESTLPHGAFPFDQLKTEHYKPAFEAGIKEHNEEINAIEVTLKVVKPETAMNKEASIKLNAPQQGDLFASKVADTFEEAVDMCVDALKRQLEKSKKDK